MLLPQSIDESNIAHTRALPRNLDWEALRELMLLGRMEQVVAINANLGKILARELGALRNEIPERHPYVDYAAPTIKVRRDRICFDEKHFFNDPAAITTQLERQEPALHETYVNLAK
jgi:hypothetical protein